MWVGACLLLAAAGCGDDDKEIKDVGVYSPIITGIASNYEPAARGTENQLTAQVTNVNGLPLTYHWSVEAGTLGADSTSGTVTWTPPDTIGVYDVTVSVEAQDGDQHFFKTMTVHMSVDNQYTRWTRSDQIQSDPAPTSDGRVLYVEIHNVAVGNADVYRVDTPLGTALQLTSGFFSAVSPTPRSDLVDFAFAGRVNSTQTVPSIYLLPFGGGDTASARLLTSPNSAQTRLGNPRFARQGTRLAYTSDSLSTGFPKVWWRDAANLASAPVGTVSPASGLFLNVYLNPSWGPDVTGDGNPDTVLVVAADPFGAVQGLSKIATPDSGYVHTDVPWLFDAQVQTPDWSPDGLHVTFAKKNPGTNDGDIWIINRAANDISQAVRVTSGPADDSQPRFSNDGSIFFVSNRVDRYGVTGVNGTERRGRNIWSVAQFDRP